MNILLIGKQGQVAWELRRSLSVVGNVTALDRRELDLGVSSSIRPVIRSIRPDVIVNAGAYTAVDKAEDEEELVMRINGVAPGILAEEAKEIGAFLVHYSTDYVFDGSKSEPYDENDTPNPINAYGRTKLAGEKAIAEVGGRWIILRTSWVYAARGANFLHTMLRMAAERDSLNIVSDQVGSPTWSRTIADATAHVLTQSRTDATNQCTGIFHLCSEGATSWYGFARAIFEAAVPNIITRAPALHAISTSQYRSPITRPLNSRLSTKRFKATFEIQLPMWRDALELCMAQLSDVATAPICVSR